MKRCAIYARYSSDLQSPTSIEDQRHLCRVYAERRAWTVVSVFEDATLSGFGIEHRPGYQQLLAAALSSPAAFEVAWSRICRASPETWPSSCASPRASGSRASNWSG